MEINRILFKRPELMLFLSLLLMAAAATLVWLNVWQSPATGAVPTQISAPSEETSRVRIYAAAAPIARGEVITAQALSAQNISGFVPPGAAADPDAIVGRVALTDIQAGQIILIGSLSADKTAAGISALIPEGSRAFALRVAEEDIVGGFVQTGDHVDVFVTLPSSVYPQDINAREDGDQSKSALLLQNIVVLAVGESLSPTGEVNADVRTVTLALEPDALARLALAGRLGTVSMAIRNPSDNTIVAAPLMALDDLAPSALPAAQNAPSPSQRAATPSGPRITVHTGTERSVVYTAR